MVQAGHMSENVQVEGEVRVATTGTGPHPEDMSDKPSRPESAYEALERLPENVVGEIIAGELYVSPRPRTRHGWAAFQLGYELGSLTRGPGRGGPGGWVFLPEQELHFDGDVLVPDLSGWRRERLPEIPDVVGITIAPDWLCEVLSPSTEALDRNRKMAVYARERIGHVWLVDPRSRTLEVYRLEEGAWKKLGVHTGEVTVHAEPFEVLPVELGSLWER